MRIVVDTNVLYSALVAKGFCEDVVDEAVGQCEIIWSRPLQHELADLLHRKHSSGPGTRTATAAWAELCHFVEPDRDVRGVCRDPDDDLVLATAVAGEADCVVTGDDDLLALGAYRGIRILSPRQFWELLTGPGPITVTRGVVRPPRSGRSPPAGAAN